MDVGRLWAEEAKKGNFRKSAGGGQGKDGAGGADGRDSLASHSDDLCSSCRRNGRVYCPHKPILALKAEMAQTLDKQDFFGPSPPNMFVGHFGYPTINWGPMVALQDGIPDNPKDWYGWDFDQIVRARSVMVRGKSQGKVGIASVPKSAGMGREAAVPRMLADAQEAAMSFTQVDLELHFSKKPDLRIELHSVHQPMGPSAPLEKLRLAENSKIPKKVDELVDEKVGAQAAMRELMIEGFDEHYLTRLLTSGVLGKPERRKLVPTRWGITAVDDTIAKEHMKKIREMPLGDDFLLLFNEYLGNRFHVLLMPGSWEYEGFEAWCGPSGSFAISEEYEPFYGRSNYAESQGGGYYAARLGVTEGLAEKYKRQYRAIVIREILPEYDLPVGVWQIRQQIREAFKKPPRKYATLAEMLATVRAELKLSLENYSKKSKVLTQKRLMDY